MGTSFNGKPEATVLFTTRSQEIGLAASFNQMSADLAQATALRRQMTADIAHELRNPLSVVRGNLEAMFDGVYPLDVEHLEPVYESFPGWQDASRGATAMEDLPSNARRYLRKMEELCGAPVHIVSTGPDRSENIVIRYPFDL